MARLAFYIMFILIIVIFICNTISDVHFTLQVAKLNNFQFLKMYLLTANFKQATNYFVYFYIIALLIIFRGLTQII